MSVNQSRAPPKSVTNAVNARIAKLEGINRANFARSQRKAGAENLKFIQSLTKAGLSRTQITEQLKVRAEQQQKAREAAAAKQKADLERLRAEFLAQETAKFNKVLADRAAAARRTSKQQAQSAAIKEQEARALGTVVGTRQEGTPVLIGGAKAEADKLKAAGVDVKLNEQGGRDLSLELQETLTVQDKPLGTDLVKGIEGGGRAFSVDLAENIGFSDVKEAEPQTITVQVGKEPEEIPIEQIAKRDFELDLATGQLVTKVTTKQQVAATKQQVTEQKAFGDLLASGQAIIPNIDSLVTGQALLLPQREEKKEGTVIRQEGIVDRVDQPPAPTLDQQLEQTITNVGKFAEGQSKESDRLFAQLFGERRLGGESLKGGKATALEKTLQNIGLFGSGVSKFVAGAGGGLLEEGLSTFAFGVNLERQGAPIFKQLVTGGRIETKPIEIGGTGRFRTFINLPTGRIIGGQVTSLDRNVAQIKIPETAPSGAITEITSDTGIGVAGSLAGGIRQSGAGVRSFLETGDAAQLQAGLGSFQAAGVGLQNIGSNIGKIVEEQGLARSVGQTAFLFLPVTPKGARQLIPFALSRVPITTGAVKLVTKSARVGGLEIKAFGKTLGGGGKIVTKTVTEPEVLKGATTLVFGLGGKRSVGIFGKSAVKGILDVESKAPITSQVSKALEPIAKPERKFFLGSPSRKIENLGLENLNTIDRGLETITLRGFERKLFLSDPVKKELVRLEKIRPDDPKLLSTIEEIGKFVKRSPEGRQLKTFADPEIRAPIQSLKKGEEAKRFLKLLPELPKSKGGLGQNLTTLTERLTSDVDVDFAGLFRGQRQALSKAQKGEKLIKDASILEGNTFLTKQELAALGKEIGTDSQLFLKAAKEGIPRGAIRQGTKVFTGFKSGESLVIPKIPLKRDEFIHGTTLAIAKRIQSGGLDLTKTQRGLFFAAKEPRLPSGFSKKAVAKAKELGLTGEELQPALTTLVLKDGIGFKALGKFVKKKLRSRDFIEFQDNVVDNARKQGFKFGIKPYKALETVGNKLEAIVFDEKALKRTKAITPLTTQDNLFKSGKEKFLELLTEKDEISKLAKSDSPAIESGKRAFGIKERKPTLVTSPFLSRQLKKPLKLGFNPIKKTFGRKAAEVTSVQDQTLNKLASISAIQSKFSDGAELIGREAAKGLRRDQPLSQGRVGAPSFRQFKDVADLTAEGANIDTLAFLFRERGEKRGAKFLGRRDIKAAERLTELRDDLRKLTPEVDLNEFALKNKLPKGQTSIFKDPKAAKAAEGFASTKAKPNTLAGAKLKKQSDSLNKIIDTQIDTRPPSIPSANRFDDFDIRSTGSLAAKNADKAISVLGKIEAPSGFSPPKSKPDSFVSKTIDNLTSFSKSPFDNSMSKNLNSITKISSPSSLPASQVSPIGFKPSPKSVTSPPSKPSVNLSSLPSFPSIRSPSRPSTLSPPSPISPPSPRSPPARSPPSPRGSAPSAPIGSFPIVPPPKPIKPLLPRIFLTRQQEQKRRRKLPSFKKSLTFIADPPDPQRAGVLLPKGVNQLVSGKSDIFRKIDKNLAKARKQAGSFVPLGEISRRAARITPKPKPKRRKASKKRKR